MMARISVGKVRKRITDSVLAKIQKVEENILGKQRHFFMAGVHLYGKGEK